MVETAGEKILLIKLGSIGDAVNTLPLVNALKKGRPATELAWLIEPKSYPIVRDHPEVDRFIVFRRGGGRGAVVEAIRKIKEFGPDLVIDLQRILRSSFFTYFSGCRRRLGFDRKRCKEFSGWATNIKIPPRDPGRHVVLQYLEFADFLGVGWDEVEFGINIPEEDIRSAGGLLPAGFAAGKIISMNVGAAKPANRWSPDRWAGLAGTVIRKTSCRVVITGGETDRERAETIMEMVRGGERMVNCAGRTTLKELGGIFLSSAAVVSGDTGPMHIASALGIPTVGLFGAADYRRTGPFNHRDLVVTSPASCSPCGRRRCRSRRCMKEILPDTVFEKLRAVLDSREEA